MSLKNLSTEAMILLSAAWLDPKQERPLLESVPLLASLLPAIESAHRGLTGLGPSSSGTGDALERIRGEAERQDERHDRKVRGSFWLLTGLAELAEDPAQKEEYLDLRDRLVPRGSATTSLSYLDEAGNVEMVVDALDADVRAALRRIPTVAGRTLEDEVDAWIEAGRALGHLENERVQLEHERAAGADAQGNVQALRSRWIRVVQALVFNLELVPDPDPGMAERLLGPLRKAEAKADRRAAARAPQDGDGSGG